MKKFGNRGEEFFREFFVGPLEQLPSEPASDTRETAMKEISRFLESCYNFGVNPLPHLRKRLSRYEWQYHYFGRDLRPEDRIGDLIVKPSDFIWWIDHEGFVTASLPDRPRRIHHYVYRGETCYIETMRLIMQAGATIVSENPHVVEWANGLINEEVA